MKNAAGYRQGQVLPSRADGAPFPFFIVVLEWAYARAYGLRLGLDGLRQTLILHNPEQSLVKQKSGSLLRIRLWQVWQSSISSLRLEGVRPYNTPIGSQFEIEGLL